MGKTRFREERDFRAAYFASRFHEKPQKFRTIWCRWKEGVYRIKGSSTDFLHDEIDQPV